MASLRLYPRPPYFQYWYLRHVSFDIASPFDIASYADDNTLYIIGPTEDLVKAELVMSCTYLFSGPEKTT